MIGLFLLFGKDGAERDEVGYYGNNVDHVHDALEKDELEWTADKSHDKFERKPNDANGLDEKERLVEVRYVVFDDGEVRGVGLVGRGRVDVCDAVALEVGQCLEAECDNTCEDYRDRDNGDDACPLRRLRVFEQQPHLSLQLVRRKDSLLFFHKSF